MVSRSNDKKLTSADVKIRECIDKGKSFILDAGAGSGKTTSLVVALRYLIDTERAIKLAQNSQRIACITYTNVAKDEIIERTANNSLIYVSTIHDFLWLNIKSYQKELKLSLLEYNNSLKEDSSKKCDEADLKTALEKVSVTYSDRGPKFIEGKIFHDDLLGIAYLTFQKYPLLARIVVSRYPYIFIDEYQDTSQLVVDILIDYILELNSNSVVLGFFGDKLQSIYQTGIGEIPDNQKINLESITKEENFRCSKKVIELLNKLRSDIQQVASGDNKEGAAVLINVNEDSAKSDVMGLVREYVCEQLGWELTKHDIKELFLTHKLIAKKAGYENLFNIFNKRGPFVRDQFLNGEDARIKFFREKINPLISAWQNKQTGKVLTFLRSNGYVFKQISDKTHVRESLDRLINIKKSDSTLRDILIHIESSGLISLLDEVQRYLNIMEANMGDLDEDATKEKEFYTELFDVHYAEIGAFCDFLDESTPFSTKHGVKGTQYDTVFVVLDDKGARWNIYSFDKYLSGRDETSDQYKRTRNLFYVCCSRAKVNLAVIDLGKQTEEKTQRLQELFGRKNCFYI